MLEAILETEMGAARRLVEPKELFSYGAGLKAGDFSAGLYSPHEVRVELREALRQLAGWLDQRHGVTFLRQDARLLLPVRLGGTPERRADAGVRFAGPPVHFLYSAWGVVLAEVTVYSPFILWPLLAAFSLIDRSQIEVASLLGARPWTIARSVILPAALPAAIAGGSLCLLLAVNEFGIVLFIGAKGVITLRLLINDKAIRLSGRLCDRGRQCGADARAVRTLPAGRAPAHGLKRDARLVAIRSLGGLGRGGASHRHHPHRAFRHHPDGELREPGERRAVDRLYLRALSRHASRRFGRCCFRGPRHRARRKPARAGLRDLGRARAPRAGRSLEQRVGFSLLRPERRALVSVGLGLLVAFSQRPTLLNGTTAIVVLAHFVLISAFSFGDVSAGLARLPADFEHVASSLGARPAYRLRHVTLPLLAPYLLAAFGLSFALSMGGFGATVMVYPPGWVTLPVAIFGLTDRGDIFSGAALAMILAAVTLALLIGLERLPALLTGRRG